MRAGATLDERGERHRHGRQRLRDDAGLFLSAAKEIRRIEAGAHRA
jgi:hypothetical protein